MKRDTDRGHHNRHRLKEKMQTGLMLSPIVLNFLIVSIGAIIGVIFLSMTDLSIAWPPKFIGFKNYTKLFSQPLFLKILWNSVYYAILITLPTSVLSLFIALLLDRKLRGGAFFRASIFWPVVASMTAVSLVWMFLLNNNFGLVNYLLSLVGIDGPNWLNTPKLQLPVFAFIYLWKYLGYYMTIMLGGLQSVPQELYEAAMLDGTNAWTKFRHITLPMVSPTIFYVLVILVINSFQVFDQILIICKDGIPSYSALTFSFYIYDNAFRNAKMGYASAAGVILFLIIMIFTAIQFKMQKKWVHYE